MEERVDATGEVDNVESPEPDAAPLPGAPEWDELLVSTLEVAASLLRARWCALFLFTYPDQEKLALAKLWDQSTGIIPERREVYGVEPGWEVARGEPAAGLRSREVWLGEHPAPNGIGLRPCARVPVGLGGTRFGGLEAIREQEGDAFQSADLRSLQLVAHQVALCLRNGHLHRQLSRLATTDGLTGVYNYRYFRDRLELEVERAGRYGRPLSLIMLDLDHFKQYNDRYGHQQGDVALHLVASTIRRAVRRIDVLARCGGDEFAVILPETRGPQARAVADRISLAVEERQIPSPGGTAEQPLSVSIGVSSYPTPARGREELIKQADEALYRAKRSRGGAIRLWEPSRGGRGDAETRGRGEA